MTNSEVISIFFSEVYERDVHEKMLDDIDFVIPFDNVRNFMNHLIHVPYVEFLDYVKRCPLPEFICSKDVTQCSSLTACTTEMCQLLLEDENRGKTFTEIGSAPIFEKYVTCRNEGAFRKYGENQVKTAQQLGLAFEYYSLWYLSCYGYIYPSLTTEEQNKFMARAILRMPLYADVLSQVLSHDVYLDDYMLELSDSTKGRRSGSIGKLLNICLTEFTAENIGRYNIYIPKYSTSEGRLYNQVISGNLKKLKEYAADDYTLKVAEQTISMEQEKDSSFIDDPIFRACIQQVFKLTVASRAGQRAPHKVILLLAVMNNIAKGLISSNKIILKSELEKEFKLQWNLHVSKDSIFKCNIAMPFWHMQNEPFWTLQTNSGEPLNVITNKYSVKVLKEKTHALLNDDFMHVFCNPRLADSFQKILLGLLR